MSTLAANESAFYIVILNPNVVSGIHCTNPNSKSILESEFYRGSSQPHLPCFPVHNNHIRDNYFGFSYYCIEHLRNLETQCYHGIES